MFNWIKSLFVIKKREPTSDIKIPLRQYPDTTPVVSSVKPKSRKASPAKPNTSRPSNGGQRSTTQNISNDLVDPFNLLNPLSPLNPLNQTSVYSSSSSPYDSDSCSSRYSGSSSSSSYDGGSSSSSDSGSSSCD